jgi:hypothetical protein
MGSVAVVKEPQGFLYDDGGPNNNYSRNYRNVESILIDPCADSVYLVFTQFDLYCGYDYLRLFEGKDNSGKNLSGKCTTNGYYCSGCGKPGNGFTGGQANKGCSYECKPNMTKPDTFKAKTAMYIEMNAYEAYNSAGFAAYYWSKPRKGTKPNASFVTSNSGDSVCTGHSLEFTNTTKIDPADSATFLWDLDGDLSTFECIGNCHDASYPYFLPGPTTITLIATNCGGSDTATKTIYGYDPKTPKTIFAADNVTPTTNDVVFFTASIKECVDDFMWTITPSKGYKGAAVFVNGTDSISEAPQVSFTDTGYYDVKLWVDNNTMSSKPGVDSLIKTKYIHVRNPYCIPSVAILNSDMGISAVNFNTISNKTMPAAQEYSNFTVNPALTTTLNVGLTYKISIARDSNLIYNKINRDVYIDWNRDGSFTGAGEIVATDSNSSSSVFTANITVPKTAKIGATVMRIAVNLYKYPNKPCGQNEFGEYQDYRLYVIPYNIAPVITLSGHQGLKDTIVIEQGSFFIEPGYKAFSQLYGNLTKNVKVTSRKVGSSNPADSFNNVVPNTYIFYYNVKDSASPTPNVAITKYRVVRIERDHTPPSLVIAKPDTIYIAVTKTPQKINYPKVVSAEDLVDGPLNGSVTIDTGSISTAVLGAYIVTYSVSDLSGNTAKVYRTFIVIDTISPEMKLAGKDTIKVEVNTPFTDPGVITTDNYYPASTLDPKVVTTSNLDLGKLGAYIITYNLTDPSGNVASPVSRTVIVIDTIKPVISINGPKLDSVEVFNAYADPGVTISDNYDKISEISVTVSGTFYSKFKAGTKPDIIGSYTIVYTATDKSGNKDSVSRIVLVQDRIAPIIKLKGPESISVCRWSVYNDAGYTVSDNYDKPLSIKVDTLGTFYSSGGTTMHGIYTIRFMATDKSGNSSVSEPRTIWVKPADDFTCISAINDNEDISKLISVYPNPNNGTFTIKTDLQKRIRTKITITNMLGQEVAVVFDGMLGNNNLNVNLSDQVSGLYLLNFITGNQKITRRVEILR